MLSLLLKKKTLIFLLKTLNHSTILEEIDSQLSLSCWSKNYSSKKPLNPQISSGKTDTLPKNKDLQDQSMLFFLSPSLLLYLSVSSISAKSLPFVLLKPILLSTVQHLPKPTEVSLQSMPSWSITNTTTLPQMDNTTLLVLSFASAVIKLRPVLVRLI